MLHEKNNFTRRRFSDRSGGHEVSDDEEDDDDDGVDGLGTKKGALPLFSFFVLILFRHFSRGKMLGTFSGTEGT